MRQEGVCLQSNLQVFNKPRTVWGSFVSLSENRALWLRQIRCQLAESINHIFWGVNSLVLKQEDKYISPGLSFLDYIQPLSDFDSFSGKLLLCQTCKHTSLSHNVDLDDSIMTTLGTVACKFTTQPPWNTLLKHGDKPVTVMKLIFLPFRNKYCGRFFFVKVLLAWLE